jgi:hypothetical protein
VVDGGRAGSHFLRRAWTSRRDSLFDLMTDGTLERYYNRFYPSRKIDPKEQLMDLQPMPVGLDVTFTIDNTAQTVAHWAPWAPARSVHTCERDMFPTS